MFTPPFILSIAGGGSTYTPGIVKSLMVRLQAVELLCIGAASAVLSCAVAALAVRYVPRWLGWG